MPIHDWTRVEAGIFHAFHHDWITEISRALNRGLLPGGYYALPEQIAGGLGPDVLTLHRPLHEDTSPLTDASDGAIALATAPPRVHLHIGSSESRHYAAKAKTVTVRHVSHHQVVAMVEVVSPGNKNNRLGMDAFVNKAHDAIAAGIHLLIIDLFPPTTRDPQGIHPRVWGEDCGEEYRLPEDKPLMCVAYIGGPSSEAFIEFFRLGDALSEMPLFLTPDVYVSVPLEPTYCAAWDGMPGYWRDVLTLVSTPKA